MLVKLIHMYKPITVTIFMIITVLLCLNCLANDKSEEYMIGKIIDTDSPTISYTNSVTLIDSNEKTWEFKLEDQFNHFTPSHFMNHMINGDLIKVVFYYDEDSLILLDISDYP